MNYWDTSAIVPLLVYEADTKLREDQLREATSLVTWWGTRLECISALCRREREGALSAESFQTALIRLAALGRQWTLVSPSDVVLARAEKLLRLQPLKAADALQLAAALVATHEDAGSACFHTADRRLAFVAQGTGFKVA